MRERVPSGYRTDMPRDTRAPDGDWTDTEAQGQPAVEDQPPGIGPDTAEEGSLLPGDGPGPSLDYGVTADEQAHPESVRQRAWRERPEDLPPADDPQTRPVLRLVGSDTDEPVYDDGADDGELLGEATDDGGGLSAEEAAVHVTEE
jgi:hypothetical protein